MAHRDGGHRGRVQAPHSRPSLGGRGQVGPGRRRGSSHPEGSDQQRRLPGVLAIPPRLRAPTALSRHRPGTIHARRLTGQLTPNELHPSQQGPAKNRTPLPCPCYCPGLTERASSSMRGGRVTGQLTPNELHPSQQGPAKNRTPLPCPCYCPGLTERASSSMRGTTAPVRAVAAWYARHSCTVASIVSRRAVRAFVDLLPAAMTPETADKEPSGR